VDGFRIDTAIYVEHEFWQDFIHNSESEFAGVNVVAQSTGRENFLTFGEAWVGSGAFNMNGEQVIPTDLGTPEEPEMASMLNFPLQSEITRIFAEGQKTSAMTYRLEGAQRKYPNPNLLPIFRDNHDMPRFLNKSSQDGLKQALVFLTERQKAYPGSPTTGTEQGFTDTRAAMLCRKGWIQTAWITSLIPHTQSTNTSPARPPYARQTPPFHGVT
jgi:glycosidase